MATMLHEISLDDRYQVDQGSIFLSGIQALVRLLIMQRRRDVAAGLNTGGFVSGYRGSPLGGLDREIVRQKPLLDAHHIHFQPGVNEELGAMAVWGSQQVNLYPMGRYDGVFGMWYGKGAGLDRSADVLRHANAAGSAPNGGALAVVGDDHMAKSSSQPHNCEMMFADLQIPLFYPATVREVIEFGLAGYAMSRYSGCWSAMKILPEVADATATLDIEPLWPNLVTPAAAGDVYIRTPDPFLPQEKRLVRVKLEAARRFAAANGLDRLVIDGPKRRIGIVASGKAFLDVIQALRLLGLDNRVAAALGLSVYKIAMPWPLETSGLERFAAGLEELVVVEEKRPVIERQIKDALYNWPEGRRPRIAGKRDIDGSDLIPSEAETTPELLVRIIGARLTRIGAGDAIAERMAKFAALPAPQEPLPLTRSPYYCPGCPHNTSTKVPEGSRAIAGIGCHSLATWMDRSTNGMTVMGGEGVSWIGQAPFTGQPHVFANLGDGTYFHSGILCIRAAVAAKVNITYKILFNDAVAMTGGQPHDGPLDVPQITRQVAAEGVGTITVVTDDPEKYEVGAAFAPGSTVEHRDDMDAVQRRLRETPGVSVLIYDQTCAAEKRRRRKRGTMEEPAKRVFINEAVCEGCGDCSVQSNCLAVEPVETALGRKRRINQSSCNKDYSCLKGFCPSFVTVEGAELRRPVGRGQQPPAVPEVAPRPLDGDWRILITGIGGTGVVTVSALLGTAAHLEGKACGVLDQTGMAQKGGAVASHVTFAPTQAGIVALRVASGEADVVIGCDAVVTASPEMLAALRPGRSHAVVNMDVSPVGDFTRNPRLDFREANMRSRIAKAAGDDAVDFLPASRLSTELLGDAIGANLMMIGFAFQKGQIPLNAAAIERAIELNGAAVAMNKAAFAWGRALAHDGTLIGRVLQAPERPEPRSRGEIIERARADLAAYQDQAYTERYLALVRQVEQAETERAPGRSGLADAVARYAFKLMAYKDEYEVARLYTDGAFESMLKRRLESGFKVTLHLAPPLLAKRDPISGVPRKMQFGPWILPLLRTLKHFKFLRGSRLDPFGRSEERQQERQLIADYFATIQELAQALTPANHALAIRIASLPDEIRGFGHVKTRSMAAAARLREELLAEFRGQHRPTMAAE